MVLVFVLEGVLFFEDLCEALFLALLFFVLLWVLLALLLLLFAVLLRECAVDLVLTFDLLDLLLVCEVLL